MINQEQAKIVVVTLTSEQAEILGPVLNAYRETTAVTGLLGAITRSYRAQDGRVTLQLQLVPLDRRLAALLTRRKAGEKEIPLA